MSSVAELSPESDFYLDELRTVLDKALFEERAAVAAAGSLLADRFARDGLLHIFGSGHSHIFAEEAFYRAGGAARVSPILQPDHMLHVSAKRSTMLERERGHAQSILANYTFDPSVDVMLVVSNSGANALPVEVAQEAKLMGLPLIAITSVAYASSSSASGPRLHDIADLVIDNHCPPGDAMVPLGEGLPLVGPGSSVVGLTLLNALIVDGLAKQARASSAPDVFMSAGMPNVAEHNAAIAERFQSRIPHI